MRKGILKGILILGFIMLGIGMNFADTQAAIASATASTVNGANTAALSYDNNVGSRWESAQADPQWIYWDLGSSKSLSKIIINWETASASNYTIQGSTDAATWTILSTSVNSKAVDHLILTNTLTGTFRYVRMNGTTRTTQWGYSIWEATIFVNTASSVASSVAVSSSSSVATSAPVVSSSKASSVTTSAPVVSSSAPASVGVTLATITAATASGFVNGNTAAMSYDNNIGTRWESASADPQWIYWDLGSAKTLNKIIIEWETASAKDFTLQGSLDATTWTVLATVANTISVDHLRTTNNLSGSFRYVKMNGTTRTTGWGYSIWETYIYVGTPASSSSSSVVSSAPASSSKASSVPVVSSSVATSAPVVSSSTAASVGVTLATIMAGTASTGTPALSFDNNLGTRWESAQADPQWIYWDLGSAKQLNKITIDWEVAQASNYTIQGSADAATWTTLATILNASQVDHNQITTALSGTYRYVKMNGTTRTTPYGYSIWETYIYVGTPGSSSSSVTVTSSSAPVVSSSSAATSTPVVSSSVATSTAQSSSAGVLTRSPKRGVAYNFASITDLNAISNGVKWFYNWDKAYNTGLPSNFYQTTGIEYIPMMWGGYTAASDITTVETYLTAHPEVGYVMVLNEPNLLDQANCPPAQAATNWTNYEKVVTDMAAKGRTIKIVGPALTWGTMTGYENPVAWMDAFLAAFQAMYGRAPIMDYIAFHWYDYGLSSQLDALTKYGKPFWVTEIANWNGNMTSQALEMGQQMDMVNTCESRSDVFRYAWFSARVANDIHFSSLFDAGAGALNALGQQYVNLSYAGQVISNTANIFGPNVFIFDPSTPIATVQAAINAAYTSQKAAQFGTGRYAFMFKPGTYNVNFPMGFYTSIYGLGQNPNDVTLNGSVYSEALLANWNATCNFWRSCENFSVITVAGNPSGDNAMKWAVSQACPFRRMHVKGNIDLHDNYGWASGGMFEDVIVDGTVNPGSQQQWLSRNSQWGSWVNGVWNMVFVGDVNPPAGTWPNPPYTFVNQTPVVREKPYLYYDGTTYRVFIPALTHNTTGATWANGQTAGGSIPISQFFIAKPSDSAATINTMLSQGSNLILTPGVYNLSATINITKANTTVLGLGYATLVPPSGGVAMTVADVDGVTIGGILFDAGPISSPTLLQVGPVGSTVSHANNPTGLYDLFFRIGGANLGKAACSIQINSCDVIGDNFWVWRADHGDNNSAGWTINTADNGLVVNGNNVTLYGMFVEHYQKNCTLWNGNGGRCYFYQSELPYDVPDISQWMDGSLKGYSSYKVANNVTTHEAWGLGVYSIFELNANVTCHTAIECPVISGVKFHNMCSVHLDLGDPSIAHIINDKGDPVGASSPSYMATWGDYVNP